MEKFENERKEKLSFHFKKTAKKLKKLKNTIMTSFQAKIGWKRPRKRENKIHSIPTRRVIENSKKILQKLKKN